MLRDRETTHHVPPQLPSGLNPTEVSEQVLVAVPAEDRIPGKAKGGGWRGVGRAAVGTGQRAHICDSDGKGRVLALVAAATHRGGVRVVGGRPGPRGESPLFSPYQLPIDLFTLDLVFV